MAARLPAAKGRIKNGDRATAQGDLGPIVAVKALPVAATETRSKDTARIVVRWRGQSSPKESDEIDGDRRRRGLLPDNFHACMALLAVYVLSSSNSDLPVSSIRRRHHVHSAGLI